jgi:hypothetical protein
MSLDETPLEQQTPPTAWATTSTCSLNTSMYSKDEKYNSPRPQSMPLPSRWVMSSQEV